MPAMHFTAKETGAEMNVHNVDVRPMVIGGDKYGPTKSGVLIWEMWKHYPNGDMQHNQTSVFLDRGGIVALQTALATMLGEIDAHNGGDATENH